MPPSALLVLVPGAGMQPGDFHREGLVGAVGQHRRGVRVHTVDPGMDAYLDGAPEDRLLSAIAAVQREAASAPLWLAGISLGCLAILRSIRAQPGLAQGLMLLTPYVASTGLVARIGRAGGLRRWAASDAADADPEAGLLTWLATTPPASLPHILLGQALEDRFAPTAAMLAELVAADHTVCVAGGHDWASWRALWGMLLAREPFGRATSA